MKITNADSLKQQRLRWVNYAKGIGIFLVVLGHTLRSLVDSSILESSTAVRASDHWIYAFHMPLFFFLSGLFINPSASKPLIEFVVDKLRAIAYPYLVWSVLQSILQAVASRYTNSQASFADLWRIVYQPVMQFWFLYTLLVIMLAYAIASKLRVPPILFLILSIVLYYLPGNISLGSWGVLYLVKNYALYLALGALVGSSRAMSEWHRLKTPTLVIVTICGFLAVGLAVWFNVADGQFPKPEVAVFGIVASVALGILLEQFNAIGFVEQWGRLSLEIYVAHTIASAILRIVLQKICGIYSPIAYLVLGTAVGIYAPIALKTICDRIGFWYMFRGPQILVKRHQIKDT